MPLYDWTRKGDVLHLREQSGHGELPTHILGEQNVNAGRISVRNSSLEPYILEETFVSPNQCVMTRSNLGGSLDPLRHQFIRATVNYRHTYWENVCSLHHLEWEGKENVNAGRISVRNSSLEPYILEETFVSPNQCVMTRVGVHRRLVRRDSGAEGRMGESLVRTVITNFLDKMGCSLGPSVVEILMIALSETEISRSRDEVLQAI
ncbi:hypothetical protein Glove_208g19 [Diversispora epigaea]|uniref:Uncharacterized protein n=1 Tax=Diversispora epigaea TaxID=1348612 RepID=A0A397IQH8_9GLOM|nr:hypothetical protein Glove_208g19 [Diversispora epigaea]